MCLYFPIYFWEVYTRLVTRHFLLDKALDLQAVQYHALFPLYTIIAMFFILFECLRFDAGFLLDLFLLLLGRFCSLGSYSRSKS